MRLKITQELGLDHIINVEAEDVVSFVNKFTSGKGADLVIDLQKGEIYGLFRD